MYIPAMLRHARGGEIFRKASPTTWHSHGTLVADGRLRDARVVREDDGDGHSLGVLAMPLLTRYAAAPTATASTIPKLAQAVR
jgi:hypothetical protein